jgi:thiamine biosynthesis protein ThiS
MKIFVNGEQIDPGNAETVSELVRNHQLPVDTTLVEHNGIALHRREWAARALQENDRLEILQVAAGG